MEGGGELEHRLGGDEAARADLGAQEFGSAGDIAVGASVADDGGDLHGEGGGAEVKAGQDLLGEVDFVVGDVRVGEREGEGARRLGGSALSGDTVLRGFVPRGLLRGGGPLHVAVGPPDVAVDAVVAPGPAQGRHRGVGGGEVAARRAR
ncbi:hypothetical protein QC334_34760 [Streptomyces sp. DH18]|uniref:hypothetical protein n=1 Tax=Streptomyces sp. DH18 TaxID=3040126 RepID=UPI00244347C5|nr:hypothetical protein [Streptomyces sp. DH18]MDG9687833.1 hypothetical protein [Streptomyces sp. DH18]